MAIYHVSMRACDRSATRRQLMPAELPEASKADLIRKFLLFSPAGMNLVAIGIVASVVSFAVLTIDDIWFLCTGSQTSGGLKLYALYLPLAALSAMFWAVTVFLWRPVMPKVIAALASVAMASHIYQRLAVIPAAQLRLLFLCRVSLCLPGVYFILRYGRESNR